MKLIKIFLTLSTLFSPLSAHIDIDTKSFWYYKPRVEDRKLRRSFGLIIIYTMVGTSLNGVGVGNRCCVGKQIARHS
jgi:hypothetical protein